MGITIHYSGRFNPSVHLSELIEEVEDIAKMQGWEYHVFEREFPAANSTYRMTQSHPISKTANLHGIMLSPPHCEPVQFTFLSNGQMCSPLSLQCFGDSTDEAEQEFLYMLFTKTQFAGTEIHKFIVGLLRYLSNKYLLDFEVNDEGEYWETGDEALLKQNFEKVGTYIDVTQNMFESFPIREGETTEQYVVRLMGYIGKK